MNPTARRLTDEGGFSMFLVIMALFVTAMFVAAGFAAANGDLPLSGDSRDRKTAYAAAEAGVNFYQYHLNQDPDYWLKCTNVNPPNGTEPSPVNQAWDGTGADPRSWRNVQGSAARYTIELLPAPGQSSCVQNDQRSMLDAATGTFRIRVSGEARTGGKVRRSIVATFRRKSFLDFLYFTDFETTDPKNYPSNLESAANALCANKYRPARDPGCWEISFISADEIKGPLHSNDSLMICGTPKFGRTAEGDSVEVSQPAPGWVDSPSCSGNAPVFGTPLQTDADTLAVPASNASLKDVALPGYVFEGETTIVLDSSVGADGQMTVTNAALGYVNQPMALPSNGVIYVDNDGACNSQPPRETDYNDSTACGNLTVTGDSKKSLTLAAANDVIVMPKYGTAGTGLLRVGDAVLGLIAGNFVRVHHPVDANNNNVNSPQNVRIDAAILALQHSFTVDNYRDGAPLGTLTVYGAIAQKYRGAVGTFSGGNVSSGYIKDYQYDDRFKYQTPPFFLEPVAASWRILKQNEQVPAR